MQKLTSILLLIFLSCSWLGYHLVFRAQLSAVRSEMKAFLLDQEDHKDLIQLCFSSEESKQLEWEDETEFSYKGEMYDVIEKKIEGNHILVRCIADTKETVLLQDYQKNTRKNSSSSFIAQLITSQFILPADHRLEVPGRIIKRSFRNSAPSLLQNYAIVSSPPPDGC